MPLAQTTPEGVARNRRAFVAVPRPSAGEISSLEASIADKQCSLAAIYSAYSSRMGSYAQLARGLEEAGYFNSYRVFELLERISGHGRVERLTVSVEGAAATLQRVAQRLSKGGGAFAIVDGTEAASILSGARVRFAGARGQVGDVVGLGHMIRIVSTDVTPSGGRVFWVYDVNFPGEACPVTEEQLAWLIQPNKVVFRLKAPEVLLSEALVD